MFGFTDIAVYSHGDDAKRLLQGKYQERPRLPFVPGSECSGIVTEVSRQHTHQFRPGDRVVAVTQGGCFAEEVCCSAATAYKVPGIFSPLLVLGVAEGVELIDVAGLPVAFGTSHLALRVRASIQPGQWVLVLGAAGGVGLAAVQICKAVGCKVVAVARGQRKSQVLRELGVDVCLDAQQLELDGTPLHKAVKAAVPKGVHVVYDPVGGPAFNEALRCCRWGAQVLVIGFASGHIPKLPLNLALVKNITVHGVYWGSYLWNDPEPLQQGMKELLDWLQQGRIKVHVSHRFSMEQSTAAFRALASRESIGKVLLTVQHRPGHSKL